ncbi:MAG TPA: HRDC domain-containing protein, partial [Acidimicrobiales bacterium]|nr:HRDC domain-containing protein [Acidimicrobiales bacterium]
MAPDGSYELVTSAGRFAELCAVWLSEPRYALDTEFHRERTYYPRLALLQVAWSGGVALVDPLEVDIAPLAPVLAGPGLMVAHAGDQDVEVLVLACGQAPARLFDTQVAAGFIGLTAPSLARLVEGMLGRHLPKSDRLTDWTRRPLSEPQRAYAASDVAHLLDLHDVLVARLREVDRLEWAEQECAEQLANRRTPSPPEHAWWRMRDARQLRGSSRGVAQEVAAWRERKASELDVPSRHVLPDMALASIAHRPPRTSAEVAQVRGLETRRLGRDVAQAVLTAVEAGLRLDPSAVERPPDAAVDRTRRPAVALAAAWVGQLADDLEMDPGLLATRTDLADFLSRRPCRLDHGWRREVVGEPVRSLTAGEAALAFDGKGGLVLEARSYRPPGPSTTAS